MEEFIFLVYVSWFLSHRHHTLLTIFSDFVVSRGLALEISVPFPASNIARWYLHSWSGSVPAYVLTDFHVVQKMTNLFFLGQEGNFTSHQIQADSFQNFGIMWGTQIPHKVSFMEIFEA